MLVFSWNCRGAGGASFTRALRSNIRSNDPEIIIILEPRISSRSADAVCAKFPRFAKERMEARAFSGGIWLWWRADRVSISVDTMHSQYIHCKVDRGLSQHWWLTAVYACPQPNGREEGRI
jgi:hypothetical protein